MTTVILDASPLSILCHPRKPPQVVACMQWVSDLKAAGRRVIVPEIADYECRREFELRQRQTSLQYLDQLAVQLEYLPITTAILRHAADLWAQVRRGGQPTADPHGLDADVILAAQALSVGGPVIVATSNPTHIYRFVPAERWENVTP